MRGSELSDGHVVSDMSQEGSTNGHLGSVKFDDASVSLLRANNDNDDTDLKFEYNLKHVIIVSSMICVIFSSVVLNVIMNAKLLPGETVGHILLWSYIDFASVLFVFSSILVISHKPEHSFLKIWNVLSLIGNFVIISLVIHWDWDDYSKFDDRTRNTMRANVIMNYFRFIVLNLLIMLFSDKTNQKVIDKNPLFYGFYVSFILFFFTGHIPYLFVVLKYHERRLNALYGTSYFTSFVALLSGIKFAHNHSEQISGFMKLWIVVLPLTLSSLMVLIGKELLDLDFKPGN